MRGEPMKEDDRLLGRVKKALGPAAATMFLEKETDRHLFAELTFGAVALYVLGKFLDKYVEGVIESLGVKDLGKRHGETIQGAVRFAYAAIQSGDEPDPV